MILPRSFAALLSFIAIFQVTPLFAQEKLSDRILADHPALVVNRLDVVKDDVLRLFHDLLPETSIDFYAEMVFKSKGSGIDRDSGLVIYYSQDSNKSVIEFRINDRKLTDSLFKEEPKEDGATLSWRSFKAGSFVPFRLLVSFLSSDEHVGLRIEDRLFVKHDRTNEKAKKESDKDFDWLFANKTKLATKMDRVSRQIINKSGMTGVVDKSSLDLRKYFDPKDIVDENNFQSLTDSERKWLEKLAKLSNDTEYALIGLKYHDRVMELRSHIKLAKETQLDNLFNVKDSQTPWAAGLGFEHQGLAGVIALNMKAFNSAAAARAVPKVGLNKIYHPNATRFLNGNMLQLLSELVGDSWNDFSATRLGIYENEADKKVGQVAIVGVVDAKDPQQLIAELKKISALSMPTDKNAKAEAQRQRMIVETD